MNYPQSQKILEKVKGAKKILVNCHDFPDHDSIGCAMAMYKVLQKMGKEVLVICPLSEGVDKRLRDFPVVEVVSFKDFDFSEFDLLIVQDTPKLFMLVGGGESFKPEIPIVCIDHHLSNEKFGEINLVDDEIPACAELVYAVFEDWKVSIDKEIAQYLLSGIIGDTGCFQYPNTKGSTLMVAGELVGFGADRDKIVFNMFRKNPLNRMKTIGELFTNAEVDEAHHFVWSAISYEMYEKLGKDGLAKNVACSLLFQGIENTNFCAVMVESEKNKLGVSFRSRIGGFDSSVIAIALGGGGHRDASGAEIVGLPFDKAVNKALEVIRKHANQNFIPQASLK